MVLGSAPKWYIFFWHLVWLRTFREIGWQRIEERMFRSFRAYFQQFSGNLARLKFSKNSDLIVLFQFSLEHIEVWIYSRPRLKMSGSQWRDRDWKCVSLNDETETKTEKSKSQWRDRNWKKSESQKRDWAKDFNTETPLWLLLRSDSP